MAAFFVGLVDRDQRDASKDAVGSRFCVLVGRNVAVELFGSSAFVPIFFVSCQARLLTRSTVNTFIFVGFQVPGSFGVGVGFSNLISARVPADVTSAAFKFVNCVCRLRMCGVCVV